MRTTKGIISVKKTIFTVRLNPLDFQKTERYNLEVTTKQQEQNTMRHEVIFNDEGPFFRAIGPDSNMGLCTGKMKMIFGPLSNKIRVILTGRPIVGSKKVTFGRNVSGNTLSVRIAGKEDVIVNDTAYFVHRNNLLSKRCYVKVENISEPS